MQYLGRVNVVACGKDVQVDAVEMDSREAPVVDVIAQLGKSVAVVSWTIGPADGAPVGDISPAKLQQQLGHCRARAAEIVARREEARANLSLVK